MSTVAWWFNICAAALLASPSAMTPPIASRSFTGFASSRAPCSGTGVRSEAAVGNDPQDRDADVDRDRNVRRDERRRDRRGVKHEADDLLRSPAECPSNG